MAPSGEVFGSAQNWIYFNDDTDDNVRDRDRDRDRDTNGLNYAMSAC